MKPSLSAVGLSVVGLSALALVPACSGGAHPRAAPAHGTTSATAGATTGTGAPRSSAQTPTRSDRLPDPVRSPIPTGSKALYTGSGHGAADVTLPASAGKSPSVTVMWTCAGPSKFDITAAGKTLAGSQCGDGSGVFTAEIPHTHIHELTWKLSAADSVIWRIAVIQPPGN
ncbi:hypothetical protein ACFOOM_13745 [Streptomyces echinoruber]|uniref:Lipoprotein n=1 Tax=Streptomyces echinoruber TaxID=68898 RepID=A0A918REV4_9ACTN|nr:hypothetical protein [Streptomyces echinoruber]GGZ95310.1 hypothetical protein GCM10010389_37900 [Streptomyces echinoruber]